jgi:hypothetical protein
MKVQFVTAIYDLASLEKNAVRRPIDWYLDRMDFLLQQTVPLLIYTEPALVKTLEAKCRDNPHIQIQEKPFESLRYADKLPQIQENLARNPYRSQVPEKMTPVFFVLVWNKAELLYETSVQKPEVDMLIWIDFGIRQVGGTYDAKLNLEDVTPHMSPEHFCCTVINPMTSAEYHDYKQSCSFWMYRQAGGFWSVGKTVMPLFIEVMREETDKILTAGYACMEEDIMARFVFLHPKQCQFMFGDYQSCISNWIEMKHDLKIAHRIVLVGGALELHHVVAACIPYMLKNLVRGLILCDLGHTFRYLFQWYQSLCLTESELAPHVGHFLLLCAEKCATVMRHLRMYQRQFEVFGLPIDGTVVPENILDQHPLFGPLKTYVETHSNDTSKHPFIRFLG